MSVGTEEYPTPPSASPTPESTSDLISGETAPHQAAVQGVRRGPAGAGGGGEIGRELVFIADAEIYQHTLLGSQKQPARLTTSRLCLFLECCWLGVDEKQARWESSEAALKYKPRAAFGKTGLDGRADARVRVLGAMFIMASARMRGINKDDGQSEPIVCIRNGGWGRGR